MGRSKKKKAAKKSATIVDPAPAAISPAELAKNGKREAEDAVEMQVITKKQKTDALELAVLMQKVEETTQNNEKVESSNSPEEKSELEEEKVQADQAIVKKASIEDCDVKIVEAVSPKTTLEQPAVKSEDMDSDVKIVEAVSPKTILEQPAVKSEDMDSDVKIVEAVSLKTTLEQPAVKSEDMDSDVKIVEAVLPKTILELPTVKSEDMDSDLKIVEVVSPKTTLKQPAVKSKDTTKTPATPQGESKSSTLFVGNLSFNVEKTDIENFFKDAGTVVHIRLASDFDGRFKGFGHVEFETPEAAQKALALNGELLLNREVRLDLARERGSNTQHDSGDKISFQKGGRPKTVYIRGFDKSLGEDEAMNLLQEHFGACGEITRLCLPKDSETGSAKGYAYIDFKDENSFNKALELNGSKLEDANLTVEEAKPRGERGDHGRGDRDRGDRGRGFRGRGDRGRGDRGRGGRGRGRFGGRGNSGRGRGRGVNKSSERSRS